MTDHFAEFETFGEAPLIKAKAEAIQLCLEMIDSSKSPRWLSILGMSGLGKTFLAKLILKRWRKSTGPYLRHLALNSMDHNTTRIPRFDSHFVKWRDVVQELRDRNYGIIQDLRQVPFLIIDDIGDEHESAFAASKLYDLLDGRLQRWTVITSNLTLRDIAAKERRIASRMIRDGNIRVELSGEDFAIRKFKTKPKT